VELGEEGGAIMKKIISIAASVLFATITFSCQTSLTDIVRTAENPTPENVASLADKVIRETTAKKATSNSNRPAVNSGSVSSGSGYIGVSLFQKVKTELADVPSLKEDFENYGLGVSAPFGNWEGRGNIKSVVSYNKRISKAYHFWDGRYICYTGGNYKDFYASFYYKGIAYFFFRKQKNPPVSYVVKLTPYVDAILYKTAGDQRFEIAKNHIDGKGEDKWYKFEIFAKDGHIVVYVDNNAMIDIQDNDPAMNKAGKICIGTLQWHEGDIDDLVLYKTKLLK
jgi:hypothetical protein